MKLKGRCDETKAYDIEYKTLGQYAAVVYGRSYIHPFYDSESISEDLKAAGLKPGSMVLFDLLLANGNNFNRFGDITWDGYEVLPMNVRLVPRETMPAKIRRELDLHYKGRTDILSRSVLTKKDQVRFAAGE